MKVINNLHQLIRENYDKIAEMETPLKNIKISYSLSANYVVMFYKNGNEKISIYPNVPELDDYTSSIPFNEQLWTDFYNELKEVLNEN